MKKIVLVLTLLGVALVAAAAPARSTPPTLLALFGATHAQPVAGQSFTGLSIIPQGDTHVFAVSCDARLSRIKLHARARRYYLPGARTVAVTCSWRIPAGAQGKSLRLSGESMTTTGGDGARGPLFVWTVKK